MLCGMCSVFQYLQVNGESHKTSSHYFMFLFLMRPAHCKNTLMQPVSVECKNNNWWSLRVLAVQTHVCFPFISCFSGVMFILKKKKFVPLGIISSGRRLVLIKEKSKIACVFSKQLSFPASPMPPYTTNKTIPYQKPKGPFPWKNMEENLPRSV